ncbi:hypothetical protein GCM10027072_59140 [Streptomyces bullii]
MEARPTVPAKAPRTRLAESPEELEAILAPLAAAGVDAFHASTRRY